MIEDGRIASISFDAEGCAATRAACACLCEMVDGHTVLEAAAIGPDDIDSGADGTNTRALSRETRQRLSLGEDVDLRKRR